MKDVGTGLDVGTAGSWLVRGGDTRELDVPVGLELVGRVGDDVPLVVLEDDGHRLQHAHEQLADVVAQALAEADVVPDPHTDPVALAVPGWWTSRALAQVARALADRGLASLVLVNDAEAAVRGARARGTRLPSTVLVVDLGAQSCSAAVVEDATGSPHAVGSPTPVHLAGGDELDALVLHHVMDSLAALGTALDATDPEHVESARTFLAECRALRESLSGASSVTLSPSLPGEARRLRIVREELEGLAEPWLEDVLRLVRLCVDQHPDPIDGVLLVGGLARTPLVARAISAELDLEVHIDDDPRTTVALGAALVAVPVPVETERRRSLLRRGERTDRWRRRRALGAGEDRMALPAAPTVVADDVQDVPALPATPSAVAPPAAPAPVVPAEAPPVVADESAPVAEVTDASGPEVDEQPVQEAVAPDAEQPPIPTAEPPTAEVADVEVEAPTAEVDQAEVEAAPETSPTEPPVQEAADVEQPTSEDVQVEPVEPQVPEPLAPEPVEAAAPAREAVVPEPVEEVAEVQQPVPVPEPVVEDVAPRVEQTVDDSPLDDALAQDQPTGAPHPHDVPVAEATQPEVSVEAPPVPARVPRSARHLDAAIGASALDSDRFLVDGHPAPADEPERADATPALAVDDETDAELPTDAPVEAPTRPEDQHDEARDDAPPAEVPGTALALIEPDEPEPEPAPRSPRSEPEPKGLGARLRLRRQQRRARRQGTPEPTVAERITAADAVRALRRTLGDDEAAPSTPDEVDDAADAVDAEVVDLTPVPWARAAEIYERQRLAEAGLIDADTLMVTTGGGRP